VADALGIPFDDVEYAQPDTFVVPDSGPTVASRTCMIVGAILQRCGEALREQLAGEHPAEHFRRYGATRVVREYVKPEDVVWSDATYRGDAYPTYGWGCCVVEVELDPDTFEARASEVVTVQDVGKAIHPVLVRGQIEGGTAQAVGWALNERVVTRDGAMANPTLTNYTIPTTLDTPRMEVGIMENPSRHGPFGAKGVGEMPMDGPAAAVVNAIRHLGFDVREIPAIPELLMDTPRIESATEPVPAAA
jgi:CO/xanthine dehydrogenase Mo-binding subunit